jgi:amino acid transporter
MADGMSLVRALLGRPLASDEREAVKVGVATGVPAMGLDGLASSAYGPEAALTILLPLGAAGLHHIGPVTLAILAVLGMLYLSYRQTIAAYPVNGGSYTVARENLGTWAGLLAAAALITDYTVNVAVGISAGVGALVSAAPVLHPYMLPLCLGILALITLLNLRGTAEAGLAFAVPTYLFIACMGWVLVRGVVAATWGDAKAVVAPPAVPPPVEAAGAWILLRAFASGSTAMTGVEAVSNGVSAFRDPMVRNARRTLTVIVTVLAALLAGIAHLATTYGIAAMPQDQPGYQSVLSQLAGAVVGRGALYYVTIGSVLAVLCLSANTSFVDFPRVSRLIARDGFLPRGFAVVGRRLVYSGGILFLALAAGLLLALFRGITDRLIPLFAVGAFLAFTLSQAGMVAHWRRLAREGEAAVRRGARLRLWVNGAGATATGAALVIILAAKFTAGAWITIVAIPVLLAVFRLVHGHYRELEREIAPRRPLDLDHNLPPVVLVPTKGWDRLTGKALRFAMWLSTDIVAVHLSNLDGEAADEEAERLRQAWAKDVAAPAARHGVPAPQLVIAQSPYRRFVPPLLREVDRLKLEHPGRPVAVVIPEVVETSWWKWLLHTQRPGRLRRALRARGDRHVVVITVPWYPED